MKKFLLFFMAFLMLFSTVNVFADDKVSVKIDGELIKCQDANGKEVFPMLIEGTTYLPVRAISSALELEIQWDNETKTVFINGVTESEASEHVNIYINKSLFVAKDVNGKEVTPVLKDGTTYLPVRAIGEAFNKRVSWDNETRTAVLTTPILKTDFVENKTYAIINKANSKAISVADNGLVMEDFKNYDYQAFKFVPSTTDGYYYINAVANNKNFDVNGNSKTPGGKIITYNVGEADNQKFAVEEYDGEYIIYALSSRLPIEDSVNAIKQNTLRQSPVQRWDIVEFTASKKEDETVLYQLSVDNGFLAQSESLGVETTKGDNTNWILTPNEDGQYIITNEKTSKSLDVANNSKTSGDSIITYNTSGDPNQCWIFEKQSDGTYLIKSVHSALYLTVTDDNSIIQSELTSLYRQNWLVSVVE